MSSVIRPIGTAAWLSAMMFVAVGMACSDGYPTQPQAPAGSHTLSQPERLAAMNRLGKDGHPDYRWRYGLPSACELHVTLNGDRRASRRLRLDGAVVGQSSDRELATFLITVAPANTPAATVQVFETPRWTDSVEMFSHLRLQQRDCIQQRDVPPPKQPETSAMALRMHGVDSPT